MIMMIALQRGTLSVGGSYQVERLRCVVSIKLKQVEGAVVSYVVLKMPIKWSYTLLCLVFKK